MLIPYQGNTPQIGANVYIAEGAQVIGRVKVGELSSIWFNCVLRGDINSITIGKRTNIQDLSVIHVNTDQPVIVEDYVSIGHSCVLHGCTIKKGSLIGMGAIILNQSVIGENCLVAAGSLVPERKVFPPNTLILGSPAKAVRELSPEEIESLRQTSLRYVQRGQDYLGAANKIKDKVKVFKPLQDLNQTRR
ncbi:MAG: gamma carbonic anhydrase family protein [Desulfitobacteriia bacterium]|jgi:carbonic anhydrase/acetyltransferase-like protein (isoleucine patch superfamily)